MSKRILVCQHVAYEPLGTLDPLFKEQGFRIRYVNFGRHSEQTPRVKGYHGLVILGGPMGVEDKSTHPHLAYEEKMVQEAIDLKIPILGICLGAQLIATALGAKVCRNSVREIGWFPLEKMPAASEDPLFRHFGKEESIFQWHQDAFSLPQGAVHLARTNTCHYQAFRYGDKVYGLQFHLEVDEPMIERWLHVPYHKEVLELEKERVDPARIRSETTLNMARLKELSQKTFGEFIRLFGERKKTIVLPSR